MEYLKGADEQALKEDSYWLSRYYEFQARELERQGRIHEAAELWRRYAELKYSKGSYLLSALGFLNAALLLEREDVEKACQLLVDGLKKVEEKLPPMMVVLLYGQAARIAGRKDPLLAAECYERLGELMERQERFFEAADAYEHASEFLMVGGRDIRGYTKPGEIWMRNAEMWMEKKELDDAEWSAVRALKYFEFIGDYEGAERARQLMEKISVEERS